VLAIVLWILSYIFVTSLNYAAAKQGFRIRGDFLRSVLKQDIGWYDVNTSTDFASSRERPRPRPCGETK